MVDQILLTADSTRTTGSRSTRRLRRAGQIPGVVYGLGQDPRVIAVPYGDLRAAMSTDAGLNALIDIDIDGTVESCIVKDLQRHPVRDEVTHVDFIRIDPNAEISVDVPVTVVGEAKKVTQLSGMVDQVMFSLNVLAKPGSIPNELIADVTELDVGESIRVADIELPAGVRCELDAEEPIAVGVVTRSTLEAMRLEEEADAEDAEGDAAASAGGGDSEG